MLSLTYIVLWSDVRHLLFPCNACASLKQSQPADVVVDQINGDYGVYIFLEANLLFTVFVRRNLNIKFRHPKGDFSVLSVV